MYWPTGGRSEQFVTRVSHHSPTTHPLRAPFSTQLQPTTTPHGHLHKLLVTDSSIAIRIRFLNQLFHLFVRHSFTKTGHNVTQLLPRYVTIIILIEMMKYFTYFCLLTICSLTTNPSFSSFHHLFKFLKLLHKKGFTISTQKK